MDSQIQSFLSSRVSLMNKTEAKTIIMINKARPPRGFITSQLMTGVITYAVINKAAKIMIMRSRRTVNINFASPSFSPFQFDADSISYDLPND
jgi:hypothetical protein